MSAIKTIDRIVGFVPSLPAKAIDAMVRGPQALALLPLMPLGYMAACIGQGAAVGYGAYRLGATPSQSIATGIAVTMVPPVMKVLRIYSRD